MITGAHSIIYSTNPEADRAFLRDVLQLTGIDAGGGWLIFGLPPAELAVHPSSKNDVHEFYLICEDIKAVTAELKKHGVAYSQVEEQDFGLRIRVVLPGGGKLPIYQPRHPRPEPVKVASKRPAKKAAKKRVAAKKG
jgi:hypothetical protein